MKHKVIAYGIPVFALALGVFFASPAAANEGDHGEKMVEKKIEKLREKLDLSADQTAQVRAILESAKTEMMAIKDRTSTRIEAILDPEQREKYRIEKENWEKKGRDKMDKMDEKY